MKKKMQDKLVTQKGFRFVAKGLNSRMDSFDARMDKLATKDELHLAVKELNSRIDKAVLDMKNYVDDRFDEFKKIVYTKADHEIFMVWMDEAMKELRSAREGRVLTEEQMLRMDDKVANHESRICVLERK